MPMFTLSVKDTFAAAHRLEDYHGKCEALHGHNFTVETFYEGEAPNASGMVLDFGVLKDRLRAVLTSLDHTYINDIPFFHERPSSSEYIAMYIYNELKKLAEQGPVRLTEVRVWESGTAWASYHE